MSSIRTTNRDEDNELYAKKLPSIQSFNSESSSGSGFRTIKEVDDASIDSKDTIFKHCQSIFERGGQEDCENVAEIK